ncbi:hypothetical protein P7H59_10800 [Enterococcus viikkiensis]|uniref:Transposase n=1 Tax=Enterococcus viikkiensis TaxID=930854 RepID=A0ABU3FTE3_9ENTE|nr:hypothetical protein [Enterococcus viikkiensis]MDT2828928.1 hypothetical protein [Enterococcus viikkiensis]
MYTAKQIKEKLDLRFPESKKDWRLDPNKLYSEQEFQIMKFDHKKTIYKPTKDGNTVRMKVLATIDIDNNKLWSE